MDMVNLKTVIIVGYCTDICIQNFAIALRNFFQVFDEFREKKLDYAKNKTHQNISLQFLRYLIFSPY